MTLKKYNLLLASFYALCLAGAWGFSAYLQPVDGDLTRIGGYSENDFGSRIAHETFSETLFTNAKTLEEYDRYYDVVVLGDSFSVEQQGARGYSWQNFFVNKTGLSLITLDTRRYWPIEVLQHETFKKHPPKIFVFESVERYLYDRVAYFSSKGSIDATCDLLKKHIETGKALTDDENEILSWLLPNQSHPLNKEILLKTRPLKPCFDSNYALSFLNASFKRKIGFERQAIELPLNKKGLFSCDKSDRLLVYFDEMEKQKLSSEHFEKMVNGVMVFAIASSCSSVVYGKSPNFVCLPAPDKTSLYAPWLANKEDATPNLLKKICDYSAAGQIRNGTTNINLCQTTNKWEHLPFLPKQFHKYDMTPIVRTDLLLREAIEKGQQDIFLPNDSHWGSEGHRIVADGLLDYLRQKQILK